MQIDSSGQHVYPINRELDSIIIAPVANEHAGVLRISGSVSDQTLELWIALLRQYNVPNARLMVDVRNPNLPLTELCAQFQPSHLVFPLCRSVNPPANVTRWWMPSIEGLMTNARLRYKTIQSARNVDPSTICYSRISFPNWEAFQEGMKPTAEEVWRVVTSLGGSYEHTLLCILADGWIPFQPGDFVDYVVTNH